VARIKQKDDRDYAKMKGTMGLMPGWIVGKLMDWTGHFLYALNLWTPLFGVPKDSFGSAMITNIGSIGLDMAFAPLVPYSRVPLLLAVGAANRVPVFREDQVTSATRLKLCVTIDHRLIDGMHAAKMSKEVENIFNHPEQTFGPL
jgi:pyruvate dehydrogenase E2 component (dihydrolipoamide acetyltransferase)